MTGGERATDYRLRFTRRDWLLIGVCVVLTALSVAVIVRYYHAAFPEASIDFKYDRRTSRAIAEKLVAAQKFDARGMKHAVRFDSDYYARIFLERSLGLERAGRVMRDDVRVWYWHHRWFRPLQEEEISVDVAPTGEIVAFTHKIPEERAIPDPGGLRARRSTEEFLRAIGVRADNLRLVSTSERRLPKRVQRIYTWESTSIRPANAPYRHTVIVDGDRVTGYSQRVKVPDAWMRSYREMRAKNVATGRIDLIFTGALMIAAVVVFVVRLRRGDLHLRFLLGIGIASVILTAGVALNSMPAQFAHYDTQTSYAAFLAELAFFAIVECLGTAMLLIVVCGAGEVLYRQRAPGHLALPRIWNRRALGSRRVFLALILGYALVPLFIAYQVIFYLTANHFGAWAPAEVPYDDLLNSALPWFVVLFAGFFPAFSEEFMSRAFAIPLLQRAMHSRLAAIVLAGFIWGFGHSGYPNQPFYIRGIEVGLVGVVAGFLMDRFGLLPLLIWHYTIDAVYTATLLFASGNAYYVASAAAASLIFAFPLVAAIVLYVRNRGFVPDDDLSNETLPVSPPPPSRAIPPTAEFPPAVRTTPARIIACIAAVAIAAVAIVSRPASPEDAIDYRITKERAKEIAKAHVWSAAAKPPLSNAAAKLRRPATLPPAWKAAAGAAAVQIAGPVEGFRAWDPESPREDGGAPGGFDSIAATHLLRSGMRVEQLVGVFRTRVEAGTWSVRFFTPLKKEEIFVEVDPRTERVIGYHKYQDERNAGPALSQAKAEAIARGAFPAYGIDVRRFDLKEALSFQQPSRRDWLFHFEERAPIGASVHRRISVRVAGAEVTQFNKHVKAPESVYREARTQTLLNVILFVLKLAGMIGLLGLVVAGLILASRTHGLPWRRALRWTLMLSFIPIILVAADYESSLFQYRTTMTWETFRVEQATGFLIDFGQLIGILFLALAGLEAAVPYALSVLRREGRARFGRAAAIAAITATALLTITYVTMQWIDRLWPKGASVVFGVSDSVATPLPAITDGLEAILGAIAISGAVVLFAVAARRWLAAVTIIALFCVLLDPLVTTAQTPLMILRCLVIAGVMWLIARFVLDANPLAWPVAAFLVSILLAASSLLQNHRPDLVANGVALLVFGVAALVWLGARDAEHA